MTEIKKVLFNAQNAMGELGDFVEKYKITTPYMLDFYEVENALIFLDGYISCMKNRETKISLLGKPTSGGAV